MKVLEERVQVRIREKVKCKAFLRHWGSYLIEDGG